MHRAGTLGNLFKTHSFVNTFYLHHKCLSQAHPPIMTYSSRVVTTQYINTHPTIPVWLYINQVNWTQVNSTQVIGVCHPSQYTLSSVAHDMYKMNLMITPYYQIKPCYLWIFHSLKISITIEFKTTLNNFYYTAKQLLCTFAHR